LPRTPVGHQRGGGGDSGAPSSTDTGSGDGPDASPGPEAGTPPQHSPKPLGADLRELDRFDKKKPLHIELLGKKRPVPKAMDK
jgi:hypothetical protein